MKSLLFTMMMTMFLFVNIMAQDESGTTEIDISELQKEMEQKLKNMQAEMEQAMEEMQLYMQDLEMKTNEEKNEIIINGDTLIIINGEMPEDFGQFGEMFQQIPENMDGLNFFFGGEEMEDMFGMLDEFKLQFENMEGFSTDEFFKQLPTEDEPSSTEEQPKGKEKTTPAKPKKKKKVYSL